METWNDKDITPEIWERVSALFQAALEKDADQRAAFLSENCPEESILKLVEELLANHDKAGDFLDTPAAAELALPSIRSYEPALPPGTLLASRFKVVRFIAEGGMGEVYEAEDLELHEHLAIKTLRPETLQDATAIARFRREVHLARKVTHPNVCRIYDLFRDRPDGSGAEIVFVSMEFLRGETLASRLKRQGRMGMAEALPLITQMASALSAAHVAGIVHGDFKPGNVVLVEEQAGVRAVVTDFGLAFRAIKSAADLSLSGTSWLPGSGRAGEGIYGTPAYMAPEQLEGHPPSTASDIYSFGLVIFEMVTGARPFQGDTPISSAAKRLAEPPPSPRKFEPSLSPLCTSVILRCLERDPARRFPKAEDVAKALGDPAQGGRGPFSAALAKLKIFLQPSGSGKRRMQAILATSATVVLLAGAIVGYRQFVQGRFSLVTPAKLATTAPVKLRPAVAVLGFKNLSGKPDAAWLSTAFSETLTTELAAGEKLRTISGENVARTKADLSLPDAESYAQDTLDRIRKNLNTDFVVEGSYLDMGKESGGKVRLDVRLQNVRAGDTIVSVSETGTEAGLFDLISRIGEELREKLGVGEMTVADASAVRASVPSDPQAARWYAEGLKRQRLSDAAGARDLFEKVIAFEPDFPLVHSAMADVWLAFGYETNAKTEAKKAFDLSAKLSREERLWVEARYRVTTREWNKAVELYRTLFNLFPDNLEYGMQLANAQRLSSKPKDALATIEALRKLPPPAGEDPRIDLVEARTGQSLGDLKRQQSSAAEARRKAEANGMTLLAAAAELEQCAALKDMGQFNEAWTACSHAKDTYAAAGDRHGLAIALLRMGLALNGRGDTAGAQNAFEQALANANQIGDELNSAAALNNIAEALSAQGDHAGAKARFSQSLAVNKRINRAYGMELAAGNLAGELAYLGDLSEAKTELLAVLKTVHEMGQQDSEISDLILLGYVLDLQGNLGESEKTLNQALDMCRRTDSKRTCAEALAYLGDTHLSEGRLDQANADYQQALTIRKDFGDDTGAAMIQLSIAELSIEKGHPADAEPVIRKSKELFSKQKDPDDELWAVASLAKALLAEGKSTEAANQIASAAAEKVQNEEVRLHLALATAMVRAASIKAADEAAAVKILETMRAEATKHGYFGYEIEARLALGEIEIKTGHAAAGRARLAAVEKDARAKGFVLVANKAAAAAKG